MDKQEQEILSTKLKNYIKGKLAENGLNATKLAVILSEKYKTEISVQSLTQKINRGLMPFIEVQEIANLLGYDIEWVKRK